MLQRIMKVMAGLSRSRMTSQMRLFGLMYEDLMVDNDDYKKALARLPAEVREERNRRIRRAMDLSMKHEHLPEELQNYDPLVSYLGDNYETVVKNRTEREIIDRA